MRTIASTSGAEVTGITINDYQVSRAKHHNEKVSLPYPRNLSAACTFPESCSGTAQTHAYAHAHSELMVTLPEFAAGRARPVQPCTRQLFEDAFREGNL